MSGYQTGGKGEGGAIFALDLTEVPFRSLDSTHFCKTYTAAPPQKNLVFAGTRKGEVKIFDQRSSGSTSTTADTRQSRAEVSSHSSRTGTSLKA